VSAFENLSFTFLDFRAQNHLEAVEHAGVLITREKTLSGKEGRMERKKQEKKQRQRGKFSF